MDMFDKMIESEPANADFKSRRKYFITSSLVVGTLFFVGVIVSIFASEYGIRGSNFELTEMIAPIEMAATTPPAPQPKAPSSAPTKESSKLPMRTDHVARMDEQQPAPTTVSTTPNTTPSRPAGAYEIGKVNSDPVDSSVGSGRDPNGGGTIGGPSGIGKTEPEPEPEGKSEPPVIKKPEPPKNRPPVSKGVLNGSALSLPKPNYSQAARAVGAAGTVRVQVTIDEAGRVISANAVDGHPLLRNDAERAARGAKFSPTKLSDVPVKVTGIITYVFTK